MKNRTPEDIERMRMACSVAARVLDDVARAVSPGMTTLELDQFGGERIRAYGGRSAFLGYKGFPRQLCISVNEEVVHGMGGGRRLAPGDIVSLDVGVVLDGWIGDNARTVSVGGCDLGRQRLLDVTEAALHLGIGQAVAGRRVSDISRAIQQHVESEGFSVVREFVGHGVGRQMHEKPEIPNFVDGQPSPVLRAGMFLAIEPMVNMGTAAVKVLSDRWTVVTRDGQPSAHFEHTVLVGEESAEILTCPEMIPSRLTAES